MELWTLRSWCISLSEAVWPVACVQTNVLVSLRSPLLLGYLKHRADDPELLYKYYVAHQNYRGATARGVRRCPVVLCSP